MSTLPIVLILKMYHLTKSQRGEIIGLYKDKQSLLKFFFQTLCWAILVVY